MLRVNGARVDGWMVLRVDGAVGGGGWYCGWMVLRVGGAVGGWVAPWMDGTIGNANCTLRVKFISLERDTTFTDELEVVIGWWWVVIRDEGSIASALVCFFYYCVLSICTFHLYCMVVFPFPSMASPLIACWSFGLVSLHLTVFPLAASLMVCVALILYNCIIVMG